MPGVMRDRRIGLGRSSGAPLHVDTKDYRDRVYANNGSISTDDLKAIDRKVKSAYANNYRQYYLEYCPLAGDNLAAAQVKLWYPPGVSDKITLINFVTGDYSRTTGLTGNGTSKYANTLFNPSTQGLGNNVHLSFYNRSGGAAESAEIGAIEALGRLAAFARWSNNISYFDCYDTGNGRTLGTNTTPTGLRLDNRVSASSATIYQRGVTIGSSTTSGGVVPNLNLYLLAANSSGTPISYSNRSLGDYSIGLSFPVGVISIVTNDRQALMTDLGRAV